jgi:ribonuclease D
MLPAPKVWKTPSRETRLRLDALKLWRREKAVALGLPVGVVFPGNLLENLASAPPSDVSALESAEGMRRWRVREFGQELLDILHRTPTYNP